MIERKIFSKIKSILLKNNLLYSLACRHGKTVHVNNARSILSQASPKPESQMNVTQRQDWDASISESISNNSTTDVSVIVPCYKVEQFVRDCIKSITEQRTSANFEILAIDDGSPDKTGKILDELAKTDSRIRVIHQDNRGLSGARNTGIGLARGETLMFVDSDDILEPDAIEELYSAFREANCDFVTASYSMMNQDGIKVHPIQGRRTHGAPWARLYSKRVWRNLRFPEDYWFEDTIQMFCIDTQYTERYIDKHLYRYRVNHGGISANASSSKKGLDSYWICEEMLDWCRKLGVPFDQKLYECTIEQLGPLTWKRCMALTRDEHKALFTVMCDRLASIAEFESMRTSRRDTWPDLECALRTRNYGLYKAAAARLL